MATPPFRVKALYEYVSQEEDDLNFPNGQVMTVIDVEDADWYFGEYADMSGNKQEGLFPKNFVKIFEPETPPRPSRTGKAKRELDLLAPADEAEKGLGIEESGASSLPAVPVSSHDEQTGGLHQPQEEPHQPPVQNLKLASPSAAPVEPIATKPPLSSVSKPATSPAVEKPASGSFRDRINAFNKSTAAPMAPTKPSGLGLSSGSGFVKKPFVAPPPSKNAYVPPLREPPYQKIYRREEDPELAPQASKEAGSEDLSSQPQAAALATEEEDQPKPTSLKERIALLQKQQIEQATRHAEGGQKREKPKRPPKKQVEAAEYPANQEDDVEGELLQNMNSSETTEKISAESFRAAPPPLARSNTRPRKSREATPLGSPVSAPFRDPLSDPNDADQSGIGDTEEGEELSTGRDESDEKPPRNTSTPLPKPPEALLHEDEVGDEEDNADEDEGEEEGEDDVDPEVKRRMEIRERMAKMSGGMGMAGMFGPGGLPTRSSAKQPPVSSERKTSGNSASGPADSPATRAPSIPIMPMPGLQRVRGPEPNEIQPEVTKEEGDPPRSIVQGRDPEEMPDVEDVQEEPIFPPSRRSTDRSGPPPIPQNRPVPAPPNQGKAPPSPLPAERPIVPTSGEPRPIAAPTSGQPMSPSEGSESDDEMSSHTRSSVRLPPGSDSRPSSRGGPPSQLTGPPPSPPDKSTAPPSRFSDFATRSADMPSTEMSPTSPSSPSAPGHRSSRVPPIPRSSAAMPTAPQNRAPPPPTPSNAPPLRVPSVAGRAAPIPSSNARSRDLDENEEEEEEDEVTEYEGDYDTDMASSATHKDALKPYARGSRTEDGVLTPLHHRGLPSLGPASTGAPRAVPPPPPSQPPPRSSRQSSDMPRGAPPPPPPRKEQSYEDGDGNEDYDPYSYRKSEQRQLSRSRYDAEIPITPRIEDLDPMLSTSSPKRTAPPSTNQDQSQYTPSPNITIPSRSSTGTRQSMDVQRTSTTIRRSTDGPRLSGEQGYIASDVDLGNGSQWWCRSDIPPPVFQNRRDLIFESEETSTTRRGGKQAITRVVYVLFMDYSQTVVTAHFETKDPANANLEQRHEPPPQNPRQDQLEDAHTRFGSRIAEGAVLKEGSVVGDGSPMALILELLSALPEALLPVGVRAFGALVYVNLANASVRQFDEIRPGDIVTFRNAKFQGHRGAMHSKYSNEVGKPDHVGVVIDWDGTKKKVRAWEQGRESRKVKAESFKLGDMRSGEVKVWRVMARSWVGWEGQN